MSLLAINWSNLIDSLDISIWTRVARASQSIRWRLAIFPCRWRGSSSVSLTNGGGGRGGGGRGSSHQLVNGTLCIDPISFILIPLPNAIKHLRICISFAYVEFTPRRWYRLDLIAIIFCCLESGNVSLWWLIERGNDGDFRTASAFSDELHFRCRSLCSTGSGFSAGFFPTFSHSHPSDSIEFYPFLIKWVEESFCIPFSPQSPYPHAPTLEQSLRMPPQEVKPLYTTSFDPLKIIENLWESLRIPPSSQSRYPRAPTL